MNKYFVLLSLIIFYIADGQTLNQIEIPLSDSRGVPFYYGGSPLDYWIDGFDLDSKGDLFFLGGNKTTLVKVDKNKNIIYRKEHQQFYPNQIKIQNNRVYVFDITNRRNELFILDASNGDILDRIPNLLTNKVNKGVWYTDTSLIMWVYHDENRPIMNSETAFLEYSLDGRYLGKQSSQYGLPKMTFDNIIKQLKAEDVFLDLRYLGNLGDTIVVKNDELINLRDGKMRYEFRIWFCSKSGEKLKEILLNGENFGEYFGGAPEEHWKLKNRNIYILNRKQKKAVVTIIPIDQFIK